MLSPFASVWFIKAWRVYRSGVRLSHAEPTLDQKPYFETRAGPQPKKIIEVVWDSFAPPTCALCGPAFGSEVIRLSLRSSAAMDQLAPARSVHVLAFGRLRSPSVSESTELACLISIARTEKEVCISSWEGCRPNASRCRRQKHEDVMHGARRQIICITWAPAVPRHHWLPKAIACMSLRSPGFACEAVEIPSQRLPQREQRARDFDKLPYPA